MFGSLDPLQIYSRYVSIILMKAVNNMLAKII